MRVVLALGPGRDQHHLPALIPDQPVGEGDDGDQLAVDALGTRVLGVLDGALVLAPEAVAVGPRTTGLRAGGGGRGGSGRGRDGVPRGTGGESPQEAGGEDRSE